MSSAGSIKAEVQRIRDIRNSSDTNDLVWRRLSDALRSVADQFTAWSNLLAGVKQSVDLAVLEEIGDALDEFRIELINLELWLSKHQKAERWTKLLEELSFARDNWQQSNARGYLASYWQWRRLQEDTIIEPPDRANHRTWAGDKLSEFAIFLRMAVS